MKPFQTLFKVFFFGLVVTSLGSFLQANSHDSAGVVTPCTPALWNLTTVESNGFLQKLQARTDLLYQMLEPGQSQYLSWEFKIDRAGQLLSSSVTGANRQALEVIIARYKNDLKFPALPSDYKEPIACFRKSATVRNRSSIEMKYGYIQTMEADSFTIKPQFAMAKPFSEGRAVVGVPDGKGSEQLKLQVIDESGKVISKQYDGIQDYKDGVAIVQIGKQPGAHIGVIDQSGTEIIVPEYANIIRLKDGLFHLAQRIAGEPHKQLYGLADRAGRVIVAPNYDSITVSEGIALVGTAGKKGYLDSKTGKFVFEPRFLQRAKPFSDGVALIQDGEGQFLGLDTKGTILFKLKKDNIENFSEGLAIFAEDEQFKVQTLGQTTQKSWVYGLQPDEYVIIEPKMSVHRGTKKYGYIDKSGNIVIPAHFDKAAPFQDGIAIVGVRNPDKENWIKEGLIARDGSYLIEPGFKKIGNFANGVATVHSIPLSTTDASKVGLIDKTGHIILEPTYSVIAPFSDGMAVVSKTELTSTGIPLLIRQGYINEAGRLVIPLLFKEAGWFFQGKARVQYLLPPDANSSGEVMIDKTGRVVEKAETQNRFYQTAKSEKGLMPITEEGLKRLVENRHTAARQAYYEEVKKAILSHWHPKTGMDSTEILFVFKVDEQGQIQQINQLMSSGNDLLDGQALRAIRQSFPLKPAIEKPEASPKYVYAWLYATKSTPSGKVEIQISKDPPAFWNVQPQKIIPKNNDSSMQIHKNRSSATRIPRQDESDRKPWQVIGRFEPLGCTPVNAQIAAKDPWVAFLYQTMKTNLKKPSGTQNRTVTYALSYHIHKKTETNPNIVVSSELNRYMQPQINGVGPSVRMLTYHQYNYMLIQQSGLKKSSGNLDLDQAGQNAIATIKEHPTFPVNHDHHCFDVTFPLN